jgi:hypothetical protein
MRTLAAHICARNADALIIHVISLLLTAGVPACARATEPVDSAFVREFVRPIIISRRVEQQPELIGLTAADKASLLASKAVLTDFLRSVNNFRSDPRVFLADTLRSTFPSRDSLVRLITEGEALLAARIFDFRVRDQHRTIYINYVLTEAQEDAKLETQRCVKLSREGASWKIASFTEFPP